MESENKNYYDILEVEKSAHPKEIENAYIRARNAYSGESVALYSLMTKEECDQILQQVEEAYSVLGFPEKRREYDRLRGFNQMGQKNTHHDHYVPNQQKNQDQVEYESYGSNLMEAKVSKITALKKFALEFKESPEMEKKIHETMHFTGEILQEIREYKNVSIERMSDMTKISKTYIRSIEAEDLKKLPADVYIRGFVYQYAKVLKLSPEQVAASYIARIKSLKNS